MSISDRWPEHVCWSRTFEYRSSFYFLKQIPCFSICSSTHLLPNPLTSCPLFYSLKEPQNQGEEHIAGVGVREPLVLNEFLLYCCCIPFQNNKQLNEEILFSQLTISCSRQKAIHLFVPWLSLHEFSFIHLVFVISSREVEFHSKCCRRWEVGSLTTCGHYVPRIMWTGTETAESYEEAESSRIKKEAARNQDKWTGNEKTIIMMTWIFYFIHFFILVQLYCCRGVKMEL